MSTFCADCNSLSVRYTRTGSAVYCAAMKRDLDYWPSITETLARKLMASDPCMTAEMFNCPRQGEVVPRP